jgi:hypothetical protein
MINQDIKFIKNNTYLGQKIYILIYNKEEEKNLN